MRPTILLAEDDGDDVALFCRSMHQAGFLGVVKVVKDGLEVVPYLSGWGKYADRERYPMPTLILLDMRMRELGGMEALSRVRDRGIWADIPIAVLSGLAQLSEVRRAYALGARTFFMKPLAQSDALQICELASQEDAQRSEKRGMQSAECGLGERD